MPRRVVAGERAALARRRSQNARAQNVDRWIRVVELLPNAYKPEPASLVGLGAKALGSDEEAVRFFLIGTLSLDRDLSRECAANCADALERLGKTKEAEELRASSSRISAQNAQL